MERTCSQHEIFKILTGKPTRKRLLGWHNHRLEDNIRVNLTEIVINPRKWVVSAHDRDYCKPLWLLSWTSGFHKLSSYVELNCLPSGQGLLQSILSAVLNSRVTWVIVVGCRWDAMLIDQSLVHPWSIAILPEVVCFIFLLVDDFSPQMNAM